MTRHESGATSGRAVDTDAALQAELLREQQEGGNLIDDMAANRNVSGSSTWVTLSEASSPGDTVDE